MTESSTSQGPGPFLQGAKVTLVPFTEEHLRHPAYHRWLSDLEIAKHIGQPSYLMPVSFGELERYFHANAFQSSNVFLAVLESGSRFVGTARLSHINWLTHAAEVGIMIGERSAQGKGLASESVELVVDYAFRTLNMRRLTAGAHVENRASLQCFLRLGFQQEGLLRQHAYVDGRYVDYMVLAMFRRDYPGIGKGQPA